jgi:hypothetical protein
MNVKCLSNSTTKTLCCIPHACHTIAGLDSLLDAAINFISSPYRYTSSDRLGHCARSGPGCQWSQSRVRNASLQCPSPREYAAWNDGASADCRGQRRRPQRQDKVRWAVTAKLAGSGTGAREFSYGRRKTFELRNATLQAV